LLEDCANLTPTTEENDQYSANHSSIKPINFYQCTIILHV
jgi:hypothetical protein